LLEDDFPRPENVVREVAGFSPIGNAKFWEYLALRQLFHEHRATRACGEVPRCL
jgi:hypothetical protein